MAGLIRLRPRADPVQPTALQIAEYMAHAPTQQVPRKALRSQKLYPRKRIRRRPTLPPPLLWKEAGSA